MQHFNTFVVTFRMRWTGIVILAFLGLNACKPAKPRPDISNIKVDLQVKRFDRDFFQIDSNHVREGLQMLIKRYPGFLPLYTENVLGLGAFSDTSQLLLVGTRRFLYLSRPIYDTVQKVFADFDATARALETGFRYLIYYYPGYRVPAIITTVGPIDAMATLSNGEPTPNYMGTDFIAISLQFYLGAQYSVYNDAGFASNIVPQFRSRRFTKAFIPSDVFRLVLDDIHPDTGYSLPLIEQFIEKGKRLYALAQILPDAADTLLIGYTGKQLDWCHKNEREIYNFFIQQQLLFETDPALTRNFIHEGPTTLGMPPEAPGNIGAFVGWQIVKKWVEKQKEISLSTLMETPAKKIYQQAGYKPR